MLNSFPKDSSYRFLAAACSVSTQVSASFSKYLKEMCVFCCQFAVVTFTFHSESMVSKQGLAFPSSSVRQYLPCAGACLCAGKWDLGSYFAFLWAVYPLELCQSGCTD